MRKIGIEIDISLQEILEELTDLEFYSIEKIIKYEIENIEVVILDIKNPEFEEKIKFFNKKRIPIILLCSRDDNFRKIKSYFKNRLIYDCVYRDDYFEIEKSLEEIFENKAEKQDPEFIREIVINDSYYKAIISLDEIIYIDYCRISRKTGIKIKDGTLYSSKKGFSEVEDKLKSFSYFIKLERGTLINKNLLKEIDYKNEKITFKGGQTLFVSRAKIKFLEEILNLSRNRIEL
ncbi:LytTR family transcriptional regulator DNA-binding domain-containing protein [Cetobacterium sp. 8H]|uniref:LytTR family transcriptional regulator DNA-binding domain-containing protein n=1 Tax=Cetobacterium sp. 8H TaxID=2759681 RepID=UPI00163BF6F7|nr:LytTR family transcriptional regulator DNA-binding domain-containing protein [Cetobacterium sp. 8H]MBC2850965.1 LytTR family transcriptional regulator DNA-binding domain-containing protein [Cetobacterium sp. 8H]